MWDFLDSSCFKVCLHSTNLTHLDDHGYVCFSRTFLGTHWQLYVLLYSFLLLYRAFPFFLFHKTSIINDRVNPFLSISIGASQSSCTWNKTRTCEAQRVPNPTVEAMVRHHRRVARNVPQTSCIICINQIENACFISERRTIMQVRLAQSLSISEFPMDRWNNKTCIANLPNPPIVNDRATSVSKIEW